MLQTRGQGWSAFLFTIFVAILAAETPSFAEAGCVSLSPGQSAIIEGYVGTPIYGHYTLVRGPNRELDDEYTSSSDEWIPVAVGVPSYEIYLNPHFINSNGTENPKLAFETEKALRSCLKRIEPVLRGPNGEYLKIRLWKDQPDAPQPKEIQIRITKKWNHRSNSRNWRHGLPCATMIHESLHLLGLVDEYEEELLYNEVKENGKTKKRSVYDCRSLGPNNSVMHYQENAFWASGIDWFSLLVRRNGRPSLLAPAHFMAITSPFCFEHNPVYYYCAQDAYETSVGHGGEGCTKSKPAICSTKNWIDQVIPIELDWFTPGQI